MFDQIAQERIRQSLFIGPLGVAKDAVQRLWIGLLNSTHPGLECLSHIGSDDSYIIPMTAIWDLKSIILRKQCVGLVSFRLFQGGFVFFIMDIRNALEE